LYWLAVASLCLIALIVYYLQSCSFTRVSFSAALPTITFIASRIAEGSKKAILSVGIFLAKSEVAFAAIATPRPLEKSLYIKAALEQL
jgi:hypothetical protein